MKAILTRWICDVCGKIQEGDFTNLHCRDLPHGWAALHKCDKHDDVVAAYHFCDFDCYLVWLKTHDEVNNDTWSLYIGNDDLDATPCWPKEARGWEIE